MSGYTALPGAMPASSLGGLDAVFANTAASYLTVKNRLLVITISTALTIIFVCAALGAPWMVQTFVLTLGQATTTDTTTWTLTQVIFKTCTTGASCTTSTGALGGTLRTVGDASAAILSLVLLHGLYSLVRHLRVYLLFARLQGSAVGVRTLRSMWRHAAVLLALNMLATFIFPWYTTPTTSVPPVPGNGTTVTAVYGGGFGCAIMCILFCGLNLWTIDSLYDEEAEAHGTQMAPASLPTPVPVSASKFDSGAYHPEAAAASAAAAPAGASAPPGVLYAPADNAVYQSFGSYQSN